MPAADVLTGSLKVLGDGTRLRILGLLQREELSVGELTRALGMSQSRVSNHLRVLREAELLSERHVGTSVFLRLAEQAGRINGNSSLAGRLWQGVREELDALDDHAADLQRLERVLAERERDANEFFDRVAGQWDKIGVDFETGQARERVAASLLPDGLVFADLGCGTGYLAGSLIGLCSRLICVDRSQAMLEQARKRLEPKTGKTTVDYRVGELDALPIANAELDGAVAGMVLHHLPGLDTPLAELARVLKPGAPAVVLELEPHKEDWMHTELGDRHLGLQPTDVTSAFRRAGFEDVQIDTVQDHYRPRAAQPAEPVRLPLFIVRARAARRVP